MVGLGERVAGSGSSAQRIDDSALNQQDAHNARPGPHWQHQQFPATIAISPDVITPRF